MELGRLGWRGPIIGGYQIFVIFYLIVQRSIIHNVSGDFSVWNLWWIPANFQCSWLMSMDVSDLWSITRTSHINLEVLFFFSTFIFSNTLHILSSLDVLGNKDRTFADNITFRVHPLNNWWRTTVRRASNRVISTGWHFDYIVRSINIEGWLLGGDN